MKVSHTSFLVKFACKLLFMVPQLNSDGRLLTSQSLRLYFKDCGLYLINKYKRENLPRFKIEELHTDLLNEIHSAIIKHEVIELTISDIVMLRKVKEGELWSEYLNNGVKLRGGGNCFIWDKDGEREIDCWLVEFSIGNYDLPKINFSEGCAPSELLPFEFINIIPDIEFVELLSHRPEQLKRGQKSLLPLNFYREIVCDGFYSRQKKCVYFNLSDIVRR